MSGRGDRLRAFLRANVVALAMGVGFVGLTVLAVRFVSGNRSAAQPHKTMQFTIVNVQPTPPPRVTPPPPEPKPQPTKIEDQPQPTRVTLKPTDFTPPDMSRPPNPGGGGRLSLAAEGEGPGDAFNLVGNPGGRGILTGGGLGDGTGDELGSGGGAEARFGWYYTKIAAEIEDAFRRQRVLTTASVRVDLRIWADPAGRILKLQLIRSTGDPAVDEAIQSVVGLRLREPPPADIPMPMIARFTARRAR
jgi:outer membrane biosynthesis protein TonB